MEKKNSTASPLLPLSLPIQSLTPPFRLLYNCLLAAFHEHTHSKVVVLATVWWSSFPPPIGHWLASFVCDSPPHLPVSWAAPSGPGSRSCSTDTVSQWVQVRRCLRRQPHKEHNLVSWQLWCGTKSELSKGRMRNSFFWGGEENKVRCDDLHNESPVKTKLPHWRFCNLHNIWQYFQKHPVQ